MLGRLWTDDRPETADELAEDARYWGIPVQALAGHTADPAGLWPEHVPAAEAFCAVAGQMCYLAGPAGVRALGLDYARAEAGLRLAGIAATPDLWARVRAIEAGAVAALNGE